MANPSETPDKKWSGEVERLLRQLRPKARPKPERPAGPTIARSPAPAAMPPAPGAAARTVRAPTIARHAAAPRPIRAPRPLAAAPPRVVTLPSPLGVWARVVLAATLFGAITQWPYARCGFPLAGYFFGVAVVLVAGGWASHASWRRRMGWAHVIALGLLFAGIGLAALQILPRVGYAPTDVPWGCWP